MELGEKCNACGLSCTKEMQTTQTEYADPCLGILPGVLYGCCGHGEDVGYLFFENGVIIRFDHVTQVEEIRMSFRTDIKKFSFYPYI